MAVDPILANLPVDEQLESSGLARRQAILQALMQNAIGPQQGQMVSGHYVTPGVLGNLARLMTGFVANDGLRGVERQQAGLAEKYNAGLAQAAQRYMGLRQGTPEQPMGPPTEGGEYGVQAGKPSDPRAAIVAAMTSGYKPLQQMGLEELKGLGKREQETFGHTPIRTTDGRTMLIGNQGGTKQLPFTLPEEYLTVGDRVVPKSDPSRVAADYRPKFGEPKMINGDLYEQDLGTGKHHKMDNAPNIKVSATASGPAAESEYLKTRGKGVGEMVNELQKRANASTATLRSVAQLRSLDAGGAYDNPTAGVATFTAQLAKSLGVPVDTAKMANSEAYRAEVRNLLIAQMQQLGGAKGLSEKETQLVLEAFPNLDRSREARQILMTVLEQKAQQAIAEYQTAQKEERARYPSAGMLNFDFSTPGSPPGGMPTLPGAAPAKNPQGPRITNW